MKKYSILFLITFLAFLGVQAQNNKTFSLTGIVVSNEDNKAAGVKKGEPIIGVTISIKGTPRGSVTDFDGLFCLSGISHGDIIQVSYIGFITEEIKCDSTQNKLSIALKTEQITMYEVVAIGYGSMRGGRKNKRNRKASSIHAKPYHKSQRNSDIDVSGAVKSNKIKKDENEDYSIIVENDFLKVQNKPLSTFSIDVDAASYTNIRRMINNGEKVPKDAVRIEEMVNFFKYNYPQPKDEHPISLTTEYGQCPWQSKHQLLYIGLQGKRIPYDNLPPSNLVFLLDVSGSMNNQNKLPLLIQSFKLLVNQLREKDKVSIVVYAGAAGLILESTPGNRKEKILEALEQLQAGGSTAGGAGIELAYKVATDNFIKDGNNRVILATDGDFNVGASSDNDMERLIEEKRKTGVYLTALGYGMGNYKDAKLERIANKGNGNYAYIDNIQESNRVLVKEFGGTLFTIAKDVKIQIEFNPNFVQAYRLIGYEDRLLKDEDFKDDTKDAGEMGSGHTVTALYEIIPVGVKSGFIKDIDSLKYQKTVKTEIKETNNELATIKFRYKKPDGDKSIEMLHVIPSKLNNLESMSSNFNFASSVAEWGLILFDSKYKSNASTKNIISRAKSAKDNDEDGYRSEFIRLVDAFNK